MTEPPPAQGATLDVFADFSCPFCWLIEPIVDRLRPRVAVRWRAFELRPAPVPFPERGYVQAVRQRAVPIASALGLELRTAALPLRTRLAHEAVAFAEPYGRADVLRRAIFEAHFRDGVDIGRSEVLAELARAVGLDDAALSAALREGARATAVTADRAYAARLGIDGVPAFVLPGANGAGEVRVGWHDDATLSHWIDTSLE